jgi:hypothetical protein
MTARKYYLLLQRIDGRWTVQFGDYDRAVVAQEGQDMRDDFEAVRKKDLTIICTGPKQADIDAAVAALNQP